MTRDTGTIVLPGGNADSTRQSKKGDSSEVAPTDSRRLVEINMDWTRSDTLGIAQHSCVHCHGLGLRNGRMSETQPCNCVLRTIFRICYEKFYHVATQEKRFSRVTLDGAGSQCRKNVWGRKDEEYMADFLATAKRTLDEDEHRIFRLHYLLGANWRLCCERLSIDKGVFFHGVYRIEQKMGRVLRETKPYSLYPLDEYFFGVKVEHAGKVLAMEPSARVKPPALKKMQLKKRKIEEVEAEKDPRWDRWAA